LIESDSVEKPSFDVVGRNLHLPTIDINDKKVVIDAFIVAEPGPVGGKSLEMPSSASCSNVNNTVTRTNCFAITNRPCSLVNMNVPIEHHIDTMLFVEGNQMFLNRNNSL